MLASLTFGSVVRLLMRTVIICRGICCTRLARATEGSDDASVEEMLAKTSCREGSRVEGSAFQMFCSKLLTFVTCETYSRSSFSWVDTHWKWPIVRTSCWQKVMDNFPLGMHCTKSVRSSLSRAHSCGSGLSHTIRSTSTCSRLKRSSTDGQLMISFRPL